MENRKIIIYSLFADLLGVLLFIFAIQIPNKIILYTFYLIALLLYIAAILALYKNFKKNNKAIFIFIMFITLILIVLCTYFIII